MPLPEMDNLKVTAREYTADGRWITRSVQVPAMTLSERIRSLVDCSKSELVKVVAPDDDASCRRQYRGWTKGQLVVEALRQDGFID